MNWQHLNILAATNYLRERIASGVPDSKVRNVYDGLLDVLDPSRIERRAKGISVDEPVQLERDTTVEVKKAPRLRRSGKAATKKTAPKKKTPAKPRRR